MLGRTTRTQTYSVVYLSEQFESLRKQTNGMHRGRQIRSGCTCRGYIMFIKLIVVRSRTTRLPKLTRFKNERSRPFSLRDRATRERIFFFFRFREISMDHYLR